MKPYAIYLRKSRADAQAEAQGEGETLARHENILRTLAQQQKLDVAQIYRELGSGETIAARPFMQTLLAQVEQGQFAGVLVMDIDRLARGDTIDQGYVAQAFRYSNTQIITPTKIYDPNNEFDEEYFEFGLFMSRREYKIINRRLQQGRLASAREGKWASNKSPYGYTRKKLAGEKGWTLEVHPMQAPIVAMIFDFYTQGEDSGSGPTGRMGLSSIAQRLNCLNIPTMTGGPWTPSSLRDLLINPVYIGKIRWNFRKTVKRVVGGQVVLSHPRSQDVLLFDGLHNAVVSPQVFSLAQEYLNKNRPCPVPQKYALKNPLAGLVLCGKCGRKMSRRPHNNTGYPASLLCPNPACSTVSSALHLVEKAIVSSLEVHLDQYAFSWSKQCRESATFKLLDLKKQALKKIDSGLETLKKQEESLHDFLEQGIYDFETFLARREILQAKIQEASAVKTQAEIALQAEQASKKNIPQLISPHPQDFGGVYRALASPLEKNELLRGVLEKVLYEKEVGGRNSGKEDTFRLRLFPKLPPISGGSGKL